MSSALRPHHFPQIHPRMRRQIMEELAAHHPAEIVPKLFAQFARRLPQLIAEGMLGQIELSKFNAAARHRGVDGLGQCMERWHPKFRYVLALLYGEDLATDEKFLKGVERDNCKIKMKPRYERIARIVVDKPVSLLVAHRG